MDTTNQVISADISPDGETNPHRGEYPVLNVQGHTVTEVVGAAVIIDHAEAEDIRSVFSDEFVADYLDVDYELVNED